MGQKHQSIGEVLREHALMKTSARALGDSLISMLMRHDPKKADVPTHAEGIFECIQAFVQSGIMPEDMNARFLNAIISCCQVYNQYELVGKEKKPWPTNRYALGAILALGFKKPI